MIRSVHLDCGFVRSSVPLDHMSPLRHEVYHIGTVTAPRPSLGLRAAKPPDSRTVSFRPASLIEFDNISPISDEAEAGLPGSLHIDIWLINVDHVLSS